MRVLRELLLLMLSSSAGGKLNLPQCEQCGETVVRLHGEPPWMQDFLSMISSFARGAHA